MRFLVLALLGAAAFSGSLSFVTVRADENAPASIAESPPKTATEAVERLEEQLQQDGVHPLEPWIEYASARLDYVEDHVDDHSCLLIKRERISGTLGNYQYLVAKMRYEQRRGGEVAVPLSVYLHYLAPPDLKGRKVVYVEGENEGKMLVRRGGERFGFVTVKVDPTSTAALRESRYPITHLGLDKMIEGLIEKASDDKAADPDGENTRVEFFKDAKINERQCVRIRVVHPEPQEELNFHIAELYVDDQLQVPIRIESYDWPEAGEQGPQLIEEFTYTQLKLNMGLEADDFQPEALE